MGYTMHPYWLPLRPPALLLSYHPPSPPCCFYIKYIPVSSDGPLPTPLQISLPSYSSISKSMFYINMLQAHLIFIHVTLLLANRSVRQP